MDPNFQDLLKRYNEDNVSPEERKQVEIWYLSIGKKPASVDQDELSHHFIDGQAEIKQLYKRSVITPLRKMVAAAAAVLIFGAGLYFMNNLSDGPEQSLVVVDSIFPGQETAVLHTDDGNDVDLKIMKSGAKITQGNIEIEKLADGKIKINQLADATEITQANVIKTPKGGEFEVMLPDGSLVKLNAESALTFYSAYNKNDRKVDLSGEAFFDVQKSKKPFIVSTNDQRVTVLGTKFNIKAYPNELETTTKLLRGSVKVNSRNSNREVLMKPGDQVVNKGDELLLTTTEKLKVDWVDREFVFNEKPAEELMNDIARWYNVEVVFENPELKQKSFTGSISRYADFNKIIEVLSATEVFKFKVEGRKVIVKEF